MATSLSLWNNRVKGTSERYRNSTSHPHIIFIEVTYPSTTNNLQLQKTNRFIKVVAVVADNTKLQNAIIVTELVGTKYSIYEP